MCIWEHKSRKHDLYIGECFQLSCSQIHVTGVFYKLNNENNYTMHGHFWQSISLHAGLFAFGSAVESWMYVFAGSFSSAVEQMSQKSWLVFQMVKSGPA